MFRVRNNIFLDIELITQPGLADCTFDLQLQKLSVPFRTQINNLLDWTPVSAGISRHYYKGKRSTENPGDSGLLLFEIGLFQTSYGLSDY